LRSYLGDHLVKKQPTVEDRIRQLLPTLRGRTKIFEFTAYDLVEAGAGSYTRIREILPQLAREPHPFISRAVVEVGKRILPAVEDRGRGGGRGRPRELWVFPAVAPSERLQLRRA